MRVAIVDDDKREQKKLEEKLEIVSDILHVRILHQKFSSGEEFLVAVKKGEIFDVVLMDIYMREGLSGIETAALMRQNTMDNILIFVTSSDEHMAEAFPYHPFDYITKPIADGEILRVMRDVAKVLSEIESYLALDAGKYTIYFLHSEILYITADANYCVVHAKEETCRVRITFQRFEEMLAEDTRFCTINRGILVNLDEITSMQNGICRISNGETFPINARRKSEIQDVFTKYRFMQRRKRLAQMPQAPLEES